MTCRIERLNAPEMIVFRVSGHVQSEHVNTIEELIALEVGQVGLDLAELILVDRKAVTYFALCERKGIELRNCPPFLRDWVKGEQLR